jgi:hypothetical protein
MHRTANSVANVFIELPGNHFDSDFVTAGAPCNVHACQQTAVYGTPATWTARGNRGTQQYVQYLTEKYATATVMASKVRVKGNTIANGSTQRLILTAQKRTDMENINTIISPEEWSGYRTTIVTKPRIINDTTTRPQLIKGYATTHGILKLPASYVRDDSSTYGFATSQSQPYMDQAPALAQQWNWYFQILMSQDTGSAPAGDYNWRLTMYVRFSDPRGGPFQ